MQDVRCERFSRLLALWALEHLTPIKQVSVIAIDGRSASGKTTLARRFAEELGAGVVHMDDFFLPGELRTPERFATPGGNIHHERFAQEVLPFLRGGAGFSYRIFDCTRMAYAGVREVAAGELVVVEGSYSHHPVLGDYADILIFSDIDAHMQSERIIKRNGEEAAAVFAEKWIPMEEEYFRAYGVIAGADLVV